MPKPAFEVASIHLNEKWKFGTTGYSLDSDDNFVPGQAQFVADAPLQVLIEFAYKLDLQQSMVANLPKWANDRSYEVHANIEGTPTKDQVRLMMQTLLAERFHLALHFEQREMPALALTLIRPGKLGPGLHPHATDTGCKRSGEPPKPDQKIERLDWMPCHLYLALDRPGGAVFAAARNTNMRQLCAFLSNVGKFGRPVVDQSGVGGVIDFGIEYTNPRQNPSADTATFPGGTLEEALRDQLGVKLTPVRAVLDLPVVDRVEEPTEN